MRKSRSAGARGTLRDQETVQRAASQPTVRSRRRTLQRRIGNVGNLAHLAVGGARRWASDGGTGQMATTNPIDVYLATLDEPKRATLTSLRDTIMAIVPEAEQGTSYGMPAFKLRGKTIAGFAAFKSHLSYLPHSGSVIPQLAEETAAYPSTKGSLHFPVDEPLPQALVRKLLEVRMAEAFGKG
jgi:uncharacterized protein YdhG (YjbR/CyaY superfamily)